MSPRREALWSPRNFFRCSVRSAIAVEHRDLTSGSGVARLIGRLGDEAGSYLRSRGAYAACYHPRRRARLVAFLPVVWLLSPSFPLGLSSLASGVRTNERPRCRTAATRTSSTGRSVRHRPARGRTSTSSGAPLTPCRRHPRFRARQRRGHRAGHRCGAGRRRPDQQRGRLCIVIDLDPRALTQAQALGRPVFPR